MQPGNNSVSFDCLWWASAAFGFSLLAFHRNCNSCGFCTLLQLLPMAFRGHMISLYRLHWSGFRVTGSHHPWYLSWSLNHKTSIEAFRSSSILQRDVNDIAIGSHLGSWRNWGKVRSDDALNPQGARAFLCRFWIFTLCLFGFGILPHSQWWTG